MEDLGISIEEISLHDDDTIREDTVGIIVSEIMDIFQMDEVKGGKLVAEEVFQIVYILNQTLIEV